MDEACLINGSLATVLKKMVRLSGVASGNFNKQRRVYGDFALTVRNNTLVDINLDEDDYCQLCLGVEVDSAGEDCECISPLGAERFKY